MRMNILDFMAPLANTFAQPKIIRQLASGKPVNERVARDLRGLPESTLRDIGYTSF